MYDSAVQISGSSDICNNWIHFAKAVINLYISYKELFSIQMLLGKVVRYITFVAVRVAV